MENSRRILYILLFFSIQLFGQSDRIREFFPLIPIDTIYDISEVNKFKKIDSLNIDNHFFSYKEKDYNSGLLLIKKSVNKWIVYDFEDNIFHSSNTKIGNFKKENERFISIQMFRFPSGICSNIYGVFVLLDIVNYKTLNFFNYNEVECINNAGEVSKNEKCEAKIEISNKLLKIKSTKKVDDGLYCIESSEYKIEDDKLIKTKYYSEQTQSFYPIICVENICTGMTFNALKSELPNATFEIAPLYKYGYDSDKLGFEVCINGEILIFIVVNDNLITGITVVSSKYNFRGFNTEMTISQILEKHPESKIYVDLLSEWEYIYLPNEKIRLNFKTDSTNLIGNYKSEGEDGTNLFLRKNAKIDFIDIN
jgi:hypothetical protein